MESKSISDQIAAIPAAAAEKLTRTGHSAADDPTRIPGKHPEHAAWRFLFGSIQNRF
jgi:hypothetical protein